MEKDKSHIPDQERDSLIMRNVRIQIPMPPGAAVPPKLVPASPAPAPGGN